MSQKTILKKKNIQLNDWRNLLQQPITDTHQGLAGSWESCAIGERVKKEGRIFTNEKDLTLESRCLGYDFYFAIRKEKIERALEILEKIEILPTVWRR